MSGAPSISLSHIPARRKQASIAFPNVTKPIQRLPRLPIPISQRNSLQAYMPQYGGVMSSLSPFIAAFTFVLSANKGSEHKWIKVAQKIRENFARISQW